MGGYSKLQAIILAGTADAHVDFAAMCQAKRVKARIFQASNQPYSRRRLMATLTIRNVDEAIKTHLRIRAAAHGHSMEEEVRCILRRELMTPASQGGLGSRLVSRFRDVAGDLPLPERGVPRPPIELDRSD